jgi:cytoskeletal protein RodZ
MKPHLIAIAASALFASGIGVASAASSNTMSKTPPATQATQATAKDNLSLTLSQQRTAWLDISKQASAQPAPSNFTASVGATVPGDVSLQSVPASVTARVSSLKPYDYALLHNRLLIVNPNDKKIVDVIKHRA